MKTFLHFLKVSILFSTGFCIFIGALAYWGGTLICDAEDEEEREKARLITGLADEAYNGIDISHHNNHLDWGVIEKDPCIQFVYIKATEGANFVDNRYRVNVDSAKRHGLPVGAYHYFNAKSALQQFANIKKNVRRQDIDLIPVIDVEAFGLRGYKGDWELIRSNLLQLCDLMQQYYGTKPMLYMNADTYMMLGKQFDSYKIWLMPMVDDNRTFPNVVMKQKIGKLKINNQPIDKNWINNLNNIIYARI